PCHAVADGVDDSGGLESENGAVWQRIDGRQATATDLQICRTHAGHKRLDPDLAFRRLRQRNLSPLENARRAVLRKNAGTGHVQAPSGDGRVMVWMKGRGLSKLHDVSRNVPTRA